MKWTGRQESGNIEDRRGLSRGGIIAGGGISGLILLVLALIFGVDPSQLLQQTDPGAGGGSETRSTADPAEEQMRKFTAVVLKDTEDVWNKLFREQLHKQYREPKLVLFSGQDRSACGFATAATGPFYCPADEKVYIDLQFFNELARRYRAAGDFAQAYVVAHEIGHHVQKQLGIFEQRERARGRISQAEENQLSVRTELQADFLAGIWAHHDQQMKNILEPGDLDEALSAANAVGDDRLQKQGQGYVVPDSFTHGTSAQRARWFRLGFETGDLSKMMDPFKVSYNNL
jgi:predicted metalloprotease